MKRAKVLAMVVGSFAMLGLALSPVPALATSIIQFNLFIPTGGTISYAGGPAPLVGSSITVDSVVGIDTPLHDGVSHSCLSCVLTFTTGPHSSGWSWSGGGPISISGTDDLNNSGTTNAGDAFPVLLTGTFGTATVTPTTAGIIKLAVGDFSDFKNPVLTSYYGLATGPYTGNFSLNFQLMSVTAAPNAFTSRHVLSGHVFNAINIPEESSLLLLGSGLLSLAFWGRKKFIKGVIKGSIALGC